MIPAVSASSAAGVERSAFLRVVYGAATWLLLVTMPWLAVAVMFSLLVFPLLPVCGLTLVGYLILTLPPGGLRRLTGWGSALLMVAGVIWTEWCALRAADGVARRIVAAGRGMELQVPALEPIGLGLLGALLFFTGVRLGRRAGIAPSAVWDAVALALVCPAVAFLVSLHRLPLST